MAALKMLHVIWNKGRPSNYGKAMIVKLELSKAFNRVE